MARIVKRFFILPNAATTHDLVDIRQMSAKPGGIMPAAIRRRQPTQPATHQANQPAAPFPSSSALLSHPRAGASHEAAPRVPAPHSPVSSPGSLPMDTDTSPRMAQDDSHGAATIDAPPPAAPATVPAPARKPETDKPKAWHVVLLDSDQHTYQYVIEMMMKIFRHPLERAVQIAMQVDGEGRAICCTTHRELAELRVEQIRGFGVDPLIASCRTSMRCYLEPAE